MMQWPVIDGLTTGAVGHPGDHALNIPKKIMHRG